MSKKNEKLFFKHFWVPSTILLHENSFNEFLWLKMWYFHKMEYYSAIRNDKLEDFIYKWMDLEPILISEINQTYICKYHIVSLV